MEISTQNYQIVFLLDLLNSAQKDSNEVDIVKNAAALKSTVLKILSFFAGKRGTADSLKWGYSYISEKLYVQRYEFKEFKLKQFEEFEQDVEHKIQDLSTKEANTIETLSSALKIVSQNFCWDQPDLSSPVRRKPKTYFTQNKKTRKQNSVNEIPVTKQRNIVFVVAPCPDSEHMLQQFVGSKTTISSKMLKDKLMVDDRLFRDINIQLYWIDTNVSFLQKSVNIAHDIKGITMLSTLLQNNLNGMVIPVNALLQCGRHATTTIQSALGITSHFHNQSEENSNPSHPDSKDHTDGHLCNASKSDNQLESNNDSSELLSRNNFKQRMTSFPLPLSAILDYYTKPNRYSDDSSQSWQVCLCRRKRDETLEVFCQLEMQDFCPQRVLRCNNSKTDTVSAPASCVNSNLKSVEVAAAVSVKKDTNTSTLLSVDVVDQDVKPQDGFMYICGVIPSSSISVDMCNQSHAYGCIGLEQSLEGGCTAEKQLSLWYQNLLTILSKKNLSLVVEFMDLFSGLPVTAVLQPLTFSMATLRLILPEKVIYLDKSLIFGFSQTENDCCNMLTFAAKKAPSFSMQHIDPWYSTHPSYGTCHELIKELILVNEEKEHHPPVSSLMQDLQQLYWKEQQKDKDDKMEKEQELRMKQHDTDEPKKLKPKRTIKRNNSQALIRGNLMVDKSREVIKKQIHKNSSDNKKIEAERLSVDLKMRRQEIEKKVQTQEFKDKEDLLSQLNEKYEEALLKESLLPVSAQSLVYTPLHYCKKMNIENPQICAKSILDECLILTDKQLRGKHNNMSTDEDKNRKKIDILLQVLLRVEREVAMPCEESRSEVVEQIQILLGAVSILSEDTKDDTIFLNEVLMENYVFLCPKFLCEIYEEMMLPLPAELCPYSESQDDDDADDEKPIASCKSAGSVGSLDSDGSARLRRTRSMVRHPSLADVVLRKHIIIPAQVAKKKDEKQTQKPRTSARKEKQKESKKTEVKKVRRNLFYDEEDSSSPMPCDVKSNKLERRNSVAVMQRPKQPTTPKRRSGGQLVLKTKSVAETPKSKQVSNAMLQRLNRARRRSQIPTTTEVKVVEESPEKAVKLSSKALTAKILSPRSRIKTLRRRNSFYSASQKEHSRNLQKSREVACRLAGKHFISPSRECLGYDSKLITPTKVVQVNENATTPGKTSPTAQFLLSEIFSPSSLKRVRKFPIQPGVPDSPCRNTRSQISLTPTKLSLEQSTYVTETPEKSLVVRTPVKEKLMMSPSYNTRYQLRNTPCKAKNENTALDANQSLLLSPQSRISNDAWMEKTPKAVCSNVKNIAVETRQTIKSPSTMRKDGVVQPEDQTELKIKSSLTKRFECIKKMHTFSVGQVEKADSKVSERLFKTPTKEVSSAKDNKLTECSPSLNTRSRMSSPSHSKPSMCSPTSFQVSPSKQRWRIKTPESLSKWPRRKQFSPGSQNNKIVLQRIHKEEIVSPMGSPIFSGKRKKSSSGSSSDGSCENTGNSPIFGKVVSPYEASRQEKMVKRLRLSDKDDLTDTDVYTGNDSVEQTLNVSGEIVESKTLIRKEDELPVDVEGPITRSQSAELIKSTTTNKTAESLNVPMTRKRSREISPLPVKTEYIRVTEEEPKHSVISEQYRPSPKRVKGFVRSPETRLSKLRACVSSTSSLSPGVGLSQDPLNTHITFASPVNGNTHQRFPLWSSPSIESSLGSSINSGQKGSGYFSSDNDEVFLGLSTPPLHQVTLAARATGSEKLSPAPLSRQGLDMLMNSPMNTPMNTPGKGRKQSEDYNFGDCKPRFTISRNPVKKTDDLSALSESGKKRKWGRTTTQSY